MMKWQKTIIGLVINQKGQILVPDEDEDFKIRLCVISHSGGNSGHLGYQPTLRKLSEFLYWKISMDDVRQLCKMCFTLTRGGMRETGPLGTAVHGKNRMRCFIWTGYTLVHRDKNFKYEFQWNLILRDDLSRVVKITPGSAFRTVKSLRKHSWIGELFLVVRKFLCLIWLPILCRKLLGSMLWGVILNSILLWHMQSTLNRVQNLFP